MKLYDIDRQLERLLELDTERMVDTETGEILTAEAVNELHIEREAKIEGCICFYKAQKAEADALDAEIKKLTARKKAATNKMDWIKNYVAASLNGETFKTARATARYRKSTSVEVACKPEELPEKFQKVTIDADKKALKEALDNGENITGVTIVTNNNIQLG